MTPAEVVEWAEASLSWVGVGFVFWFGALFGVGLAREMFRK